MDDDNFIELELDVLMQSCYWIVSKFREDDFHQQQSSSRRDLIGGFFDRWINKTHELIIFEKLINKYSTLENSSLNGQKTEKLPYSVLGDSFFYGQGTKKDAPDIIGLKDKNEKIIQFALYNNGSWKLNPNCPHVEVKTFRSNQYLVTIPENQYSDDHYYVIMNSHIRSDYLLSLFDESFFNKKYFDKILLDSDESFIKKNDNDKLIKPLKLEKNKNLGKYELLGIFKGSYIKKYSRFLKEGIKPWYLQTIDEYPNWNSQGEIEPIKLNDGFYTFNRDDDNSFINFIDESNIGEAEGIGIFFKVELVGNSIAFVKKIMKTAIVIDVKGEIKINGFSKINGMFRLNFKKFNRTGNKNEYLISKDTLKCCAKSSEKELIEIFDNLVKE